MAKQITKAQAERISRLVKSVFNSDQTIRENRGKQDEFSKKRVAESIDDSKKTRDALFDEFGILWSHENP